jgi:hypothetical protein
MNEGYPWKKKLFSEQERAQLEKLALAPWASRRRQELLELLDRMNPTIEELTAAVELGIKLPHVVAFVLQSHAHYFPRFGVQHGHDLLASVQITSYNSHLGLLRSEHC